MNDDLISREWLKDAFDNLCCHNCKTCRNFRIEDSFYKCNLIENAPTVEPTIKPICEVKFDKEQLQEIVDKAKAEVLASIERPQGEWIKVKEERMSVDMSGEIVTRYKCSECGRLIAILPSKLADYPFCHCGAEMKKGGAI